MLMPERLPTIAVLAFDGMAPFEFGCVVEIFGLSRPEAHGRGARMVSICSGAFALAAAGLLDGREATTHWKYADLLQRRFPAVSVNASVLYVDDGGVLAGDPFLASHPLGLLPSALQFGEFGLPHGVSHPYRLVGRLVETGMNENDPDRVRPALPD